MFGRDLKSIAKIQKDKTTIFISGGNNYPSLKNAYIKEQIACDHAKTGKHYISVLIKDGHIKHFSCECLDHLAEVELKTESVITEGKLDTCYDVYLRLREYVRKRTPTDRSAATMQDAEALPVLSPVVQSVRNEQHDKLNGARNLYNNSTLLQARIAGDLSESRIFAARALMDNFLRNYFHPAINSMFKVNIITNRDSKKVDEELDEVIVVLFKDVRIGYYDKWLKPIFFIKDAKSLEMSPFDYLTTQLHTATHGEKHRTEFKDNAQCPFCGDGKKYPRMKGHLARKPHHDSEYKVVLRFFHHFHSYRARNLRYLKQQKFYKSKVHKGIDKLTSVELQLRMGADKVGGEKVDVETYNKQPGTAA